MGAKGSKTKNKTIDYDQWETVGEIYDAKIVRSNLGRGEAELNDVILDPRHDPSRQADIYTYRQNIQNSLVKSLGADANIGKKTTLCGNQQRFKVLTQRIPKRWNQIPQITFPQSVYALSQSLAGYQQLYQKTGPFQITPTMMGVNDKGQMKVWLHQNFACNHPTDQRPMLQTSLVPNQVGSGVSEASMIRKLIQIIQSKCENGAFPRDFKDTIDKNSSNFENVQNSIQQYAVSRSMFIPSKLNRDYLQGASYSNNNLNAYTNSNFMENINNTNRFTYQHNSSENRQSDAQRYTYNTGSNNNNERQNNFGRSATYQANYLEHPTQSKNYTQSGNFGMVDLPESRKRYTFNQNNPTRIKDYQQNIDNRYQYQLNQASSIKQEQWRYTTHQHNKPISKYQNYATSQVTKQY